MSHSRFVRAGAIAGATALSAMALGPAFAADPVAQGTATAISVGLAGSTTTSGTFAAAHDGARETTNGSQTDLLSAFSGMPLFTSTSVPVQDAATSASKELGTSDACAGLAGPGATKRAVLSADGCLSGGSVLDVSLGTLDLGNLVVTNDGLLGSLPAAARTALQPLLAPLLTAVSSALGQGVSALGDPGIHLSLGAVEATCHSTPTSATGGATVANARAYLKLPAPAGEITLVNLPVNPGPNTDVVTQVGDVVGAIESALKAELTTALGGVLAPVAALVDQATVLNSYLNQIGSQLAPLNEIVSVGLNTQTKSAANSIAVTALDLNVLGAAREFIDGSLVNLKIGEVNCGPNIRYAPPKTPSPKPTSTPTRAVPVAAPTTPWKGGSVTIATPTKVTSGLESLPGGQSSMALFGLGALGLASAVAGTIAYRRALQAD